MPENKVYLTFGRHERYGDDTAITREDMLAAYQTGILLGTILPPCATVYHSPLARAAETARFEALGMRCDNLLETDFLTEDTPKFTIQKFINGLLQNTDDTVQYYHFVTHLPVVEKLGMPFLAAGDVCLLTADNWAEMLAENFETQLLHKPTIPSEILRHFDFADYNSLTADEIYRILNKQTSLHN